MVKHALSGAKGKEKGPGGTASASSGAGSLPPYKVRISIANSRERIKMTRRPTLGGVRPGPAHGPTRYAGGPSTAVCARDAAVTSRCLRAMCDRRRSALLLPQDAIKRVGDAIGESRNSDLPSSPAPRRRAPSAGSRDTASSTLWRFSRFATCGGLQRGHANDRFRPITQTTGKCAALKKRQREKRHDQDDCGNHKRCVSSASIIAAIRASTVV